MRPAQSYLDSHRNETYSSVREITVKWTDSFSSSVAWTTNRLCGLKCESFDGFIVLQLPHQTQG